MPDENKTSKEQLEEMLRTLLANPGAKKKAEKLLGITEKKANGNKEIHETVRNYVSVTVTIECLTCNHRTTYEKLFEKKESFSFVDKKGVTHVISLKNEDSPLFIESHTAFCNNCYEYAKTCERSELESKFIQLAQISSLAWAAFRQKTVEEAKLPKCTKEDLTNRGFPPPPKKTMIEMDDEEFEAFIEEQNKDDDGPMTEYDPTEEELNYGENFTEVLDGTKLVAIGSGSYVVDTDGELLYGEVLSEGRDEAGNSTGRQDNDESEVSWIDYLSSQGNNSIRREE